MTTLINRGDNMKKVKIDNAKLSEERIIEIIKKKQINQCSKQEREQVMAFSFGEAFMKSKDNQGR